MHLPRVLPLAVALALLIPFLGAREAEAKRIPAFARKYGMSCATCHRPFPHLNETGEAFAANGFELVVGEEPRDTVNTGDPLLRLNRGLSLAVRVDAYIAALNKKAPGEVGADLQTPWVVKLLSGGQVADKISYYLYFLMTERGEVGGLEDAYIQFTDVASSGVNIAVGQFQVSDPLGKRETRLEYEDYQAYRVRVGEVLADLTYDRGVLAAWSPWEGGDLTTMVVNGRGLNEASSARQYDADDSKNLVVHFGQDVGPLRLGGYAYLAREKSGGESNDLRIFGPALSFPLGPSIDIMAQYLRRTDDNPFFGSCSVATPCPGGITTNSESTVHASLFEATISPQGHGGRLFFSALYNRITSDRPVISLRLGEQDVAPGFLDEYETLTGTTNYLLKRNVRLLGELGWNFTGKSLRFVTGVSTAF